MNFLHHVKTKQHHSADSSRQGSVGNLDPALSLGFDTAVMNYSVPEKYNESHTEPQWGKLSDLKSRVPVYVLLK